MLEEDLEYAGEVTEEESNICKDKISYIIKKLKEAGEI
jgi:flagellar motor switch protein FliG